MSVAGLIDVEPPPPMGVRDAPPIPDRLYPPLPDEPGGPPPARPAPPKLPARPSAPPAEPTAPAQPRPGSTYQANRQSVNNAGKKPRPVITIVDARPMNEVGFREQKSPAVETSEATTLPDRPPPEIGWHSDIVAISPTDFGGATNGGIDTNSADENNMNFIPKRPNLPSRPPATTKVEDIAGGFRNVKIPARPNTALKIPSLRPPPKPSRINDTTSEDHLLDGSGLGAAFAFANDGFQSSFGETPEKPQPNGGASIGQLIDFGSENCLAHGSSGVVVTSQDVSDAVTKIADHDIHHKYGGVAVMPMFGSNPPSLPQKKPSAVVSELGAAGVDVFIPKPQPKPRPTPSPRVSQKPQEDHSSMSVSAEFTEALDSASKSGIMSQRLKMFQGTPVLPSGGEFSKTSQSHPEKLSVAGEMATDKPPPPVKPKPSLMAKPTAKPKPSFGTRPSGNTAVTTEKSPSATTTSSADSENRSTKDIMSAMRARFDHAAPENEFSKTVKPGPVKATYRPTIIRASKAEQDSAGESNAEAEVIKRRPTIIRPKSTLLQSNLDLHTPETNVAEPGIINMNRKQSNQIGTSMPNLTQFSSHSTDSADISNQNTINDLLDDDQRMLHGARVADNGCPPSKPSGSTHGLSGRPPGAIQVLPFLGKSSKPRPMAGPTHASDSHSSTDSESESNNQRPFKVLPTPTPMGREGMQKLYPSMNQGPGPVGNAPPTRPPSGPQRPPSGPSRPPGMPSRPPSTSDTYRRSSSSDSDRPPSPSKGGPPPRPNSQPKRPPPPKAFPAAKGSRPGLPGRPGPGHPLYHYTVEGPHAIATFDYEATQHDELSFKVGDVIELKHRVDDQWMMGKLVHNEGMFPSAFVDVIKPPPDAPIKSPGRSQQPQQIIPRSSVSGPRCIARFDYEGGEPTDLVFVTGDVIVLLENVGEDWLRGEIRGKTGMFPAGFVEVLEDLPSNPCKSGKGSGANMWSTAAYDYSGEAGDLSFKAGAKIQVIGKLNDDWLLGDAGGKQGSFPAGFIEQIPPNLPTVEDPRNVKPPSPSPTSKTSTHSGSPLPTKYCLAKYDYKAESAEDLGFRCGDRIILLERVSDEWFRGRMGQQEGIFPSGFVEIQDGADDVPPRPSVRTSQLPKPSARALYDFPGEAAEDLSLCEGDMIELLEEMEGDWMRGRLNGREGIFPAAFVAVLVPL